MDKDIDELDVLDITEDMIKEGVVPSLYSDNATHQPKQMEIISQPASITAGALKPESNINETKFSIDKVNDYGVVFNDDIIIQKNMSITEILEKVIKDKGLTVDGIKDELIEWGINNSIFIRIDPPDNSLLIPSSVIEQKDGTPYMLYTTKG